MPTDEENVKYLYLMLTHGNSPTIDWEPICETLDLKKGAVTKRWSRLKLAMEKGENPGGSAYQLLWLCVKHSTRTTPLDWKAIAYECNTTAGAASKRYSRMKQAFEQGGAPLDSPPTSPVKNTSTKPKATPKSTPRKTKETTTSGDDVVGTPTPKRKRASPKKKTLADNEIKFKPEPDIEDDDEDLEGIKPKRAKATKAKVTPKPKVNGKVTKEDDLPTPTTEPTTIIKSETDDGDDAYYDAQEEADEQFKEEDDVKVDPSAPSDTNVAVEYCEQCECHAKEIANVLMSRCSRLAKQQRLELEEMLGVVDLTE